MKLPSPHTSLFPRTPTYGQSPCSRSQRPQNKPNGTLLLSPFEMQSQNYWSLLHAPKYPSVASQWTIFGALQYLATALTAFTLSSRLNNAIHKRDPINSRKTRPIVGSSTSDSQSLQVVGKGMLPPHFTSNFSPNSSVYVCCENFSLLASLSLS